MFKLARPEGEGGRGEGVNGIFNTRKLSLSFVKLLARRGRLGRGEGGWAVS